MINKNKKAQLKIQQMAFMLIAIVLFFVLVGLFLLSFRLSSIRTEATLLEEENAMGYANKIANSPEFSCGDSFGTGKINCIDADKLMALKKNIKEFESLWGRGITNIKVIRLYPEQESGECERNLDNCNIITLREGSGGFGASSIVSLCKKESLEGETYDKCEVARIIISYKDWREDEN